MVFLALAALLLAAPARAQDMEDASPQVFFDRPLMAVVGRHTVSLFQIPSGSTVTVDGASADGTLALQGAVKMPAVKPKKVLTFEEPIASPRRPQRNGDRFLLCTDPFGEKVKKKGARQRFCGILDLKGEPVYAAPAPEKDGGWVEGLALTADGSEAAFEYGHQKAVESYVIWNESAGTKRYKADPNDVVLRRALERLGINESFPE